MSAQGERLAPSRRPSRRPRLRVVRAAPARRARVGFFVLSLILVGTLVMAVVSAQALVSQGSFRMQDLSHRTTALQQAYGRLTLEVAELSSPGRIAREARRLGLTLPGAGQVRILSVKGRPLPGQG